MELQKLSRNKKYALEPLRKRGLRFVFYLDDICVLAKTKEQMMSHTQQTIQHLETLGFLINREKSILIPIKVQPFLGFQFNTVHITIQSPKIRIQGLKTRVRQLLKST